MKILILGGTQFFGRAIVSAALDRGHAVTLFHRGKTGADLFPNAEHVLGDRDGGLGNLGDRTFDAVIDVCGYVPRIVEQSVIFLKSRATHYQFISTISVYDPPEHAAEPLTETCPLSPTAGLDTEEITWETYGPLKVLCEQAVQQTWGDNHFILRPGFIIGPHDSTDRFTYWVNRIATQSRVVCGERVDQPIQVIDARDLAAFSVHATEQSLTGATHATGPALTFQDMLGSIKAALNRQTQFVSIPAEELREGENLPLVIGPGRDSILRISCAKAESEGLQRRPIAGTIRDTWAWFSSQGDRPLKAGLSTERENELLTTKG
jgi:2'-hydroxyisoflavone reductase